MANNEAARDEERMIHRFGTHILQEPHPLFNGRVFARTLVPWDGTCCYGAGSLLFEPGCHNAWHVHKVQQTLFVIQGRGWYQEEGTPARELHVGDVVNVPPGVRHWHGAAKDSWFEHVVTEDLTQGWDEWFEPVNEEEYNQLP